MFSKLNLRPKPNFPTELLGADEDESMMSMLVQPIDAENNSVTTSTTPARVNVGTNSSNRSMSSFTFSTAETQTQTFQGLGHDEHNTEQQESMDIETQTTSVN